MVNILTPGERELFLKWPFLPLISNNLPENFPNNPNNLSSNNPNNNPDNNPNNPSENKRGVIQGYLAPIAIYESVIPLLPPSPSGLRGPEGSENKSEGSELYAALLDIGIPILDW